MSAAVPSHPASVSKRATLLMVSLLLLVPLLSGCGQDKPKGTSSGQGQSGKLAEPGSKPLTAKLDNKPLELRSALLHSFGGKARMLTLSTASMSCADLGAWREQGHEKTISLGLSPKVLDDRPDEWVITSAMFERTNRRGVLGKVELSSPAVDKEALIKLSLDVVTPVTQAPGKVKKVRLVLRGKLRAQGCGIKPSNPGVKIREQKDIQWKIGGKAFVARGATVSYKPNGAVLRLSTEPHSCTTSLSGSDLTTTLYLKGPPPVAKRVVVGGHLSGRDRGLNLSPDKFSARLDESPNGKGYAAVTVQGAAKISGLEVLLEGVADAQVCAPKSAPQK